ncbi:MAG: xanthine phosphoribosyltransferase [Lachnospiraceae bacterium]|nr:xanthine phosphoribosyltransferase [Lachnospiraceae bacterium]
MQLLKDRILKDGRAVNEDILRVDTFINHQVDPYLMQECARDFAEHFKDSGVTKIATIESSGIAPALLTAVEMELPLVFFKKQPSKVLNDDLYQTMVTSFTKGTNYELTLSRKVIDSSDHVLIIDDFLANGEAATGAIRLVRMAHATVAGLGVLIEKSFQPGRSKLTEAGIETYALARIASMSQGKINFLNDD